jgi:polyhydroxyalkanoate synthesis regulator phasin
MKQTLKIGVTVLLVAALAMSGIALAQTGGGDEAPAGDGPVSKILEALGPLVENGTISEAQAEAVAETLAENLPPRRPHRGGRFVVGAAAEFLGMEVQDLAAQLREGTTLAEIAGAQTDGLIAALVADVEEKLDGAVAEGRITQEEADEKLAEATERITTFVNEGPQHEEGEGPGGRGRGGPGGFGGGAPFDDTSA